MRLNFSRAFAAAAAFALIGTGCGPGSKSHHKTTVVWKAIGTWSGHGDAQTDSFDIGYNDMRIRWETRNEKTPGAGTFRVAVCSAVSGRELVVAVNRKGAGHDLTYFSVEPHWSYLLINSNDLDWSVTVEEQTFVQSP